MGLFTKLFGTRNDRELKHIYPIVEQIEALDGRYAAMSDEELKAATPALKARLAGGESLDDILPDAFAAVREAARRVLGLKPYPVQLIGGIVLHQGRIAEMKTGEGKTLVATLPAYLNALTGEGVHIVTVNDYLARRDSEWMGKVYRFMGLEVGLIVHGLSSDERRAAYAADITYGTNNELGFDYLRDNMAIYQQNMVQRGHPFVIVDEVDSILIDEARTPLIISGPGDESSELYQRVDSFVCGLKPIVYATVDDKQSEADDLDADYVVDEKAKTATLTARGIRKAEAAFNLDNLADLENSTLSHHINQAIKAHGIMKRDTDYVVKDGEVIIVDEFTGRLMLGRRYNEGLHQAIEAKEHVKVARESKTYATITFQNFFRLYGKLSGMTGTAMTEEEEFLSIYNLDIVEIPTNKPVQRIDRDDVVYKTEAGKYRAIIQQIIDCHEKGQPVLVGTVSIEKSEYLSGLLKRRGVAHNVLNAKQHEREAEIVAQAGKFGAVTIATNMAGRGTDIVLGGNPDYLARTELKKAGYSDEVITEATGYADTDDQDVLTARAMYAEAQARHRAVTDQEAQRVRQAGGLFILGTERHESRRIDNQLRGRAGRQGDPGESRFFLSLEDDIMRLFGGDRVTAVMNSLGVDEDTPIDHKMLSGAIERAQKTVESRNFQTRKSVLEFDDVNNIQRNIIYAQRQKVLSGEDVSASLRGMTEEYIQSSITELMAGEARIAGQEQLRALTAPFEGLFLLKGEVSMTQLPAPTAQALEELLVQRASEVYARREKEFTAPVMRELERFIMLRVVDEYWMDHIDNMQELRRGIGLRSYGSTSAVDAYKAESFDMFEAMVAAMRAEMVRRIFTVRLKTRQDLERKSTVRINAAAQAGGSEEKRQPVKKEKKPGRNDPCPCGRWKEDGSRPLKYKECCGRNE